MPLTSPTRTRAKAAATVTAVQSDDPAEGRAEPRTLLTPDDWIRAATDLLIVKSIDAVRVDVLARILNVTRGSFYWHFTDRDDLLKRVLLRWQESQTEQIIARYKRQGVAAEDLIRELVELPFHGRAAMKGSSVELAIRSWARRDDEARMIVDQVDAKRLIYISECFSSLGFGAAEARARAFVLYCYMQSESLFRNQGTANDKVERRKFIAQMLLDPSKA